MIEVKVDATICYIREQEIAQNKKEKVIYTFNKNDLIELFDFELDDADADGLSDFVIDERFLKNHFKRVLDRISQVSDDDLKHKLRCFIKYKQIDPFTFFYADEACSEPRFISIFIKKAGGDINNEAYFEPFDFEYASPYN